MGDFKRVILKVNATVNIVGMVIMMGLAMGANGGGCAHGCTPAQTQAWKDCEVSTFTTPKQTQLLVDVTSALYSFGWEQALIQLVKEVGQDQVNCAVVAVRGELQRKLGSARGQMSTNNILALNNADRWISDHGGK